MDNDGVALVITNSTFSSNSASEGRGGGISNERSTTNVSGMLTVTNTIVANSISGGNCYGAVIDGGHNIDDSTTCGLTGTSDSLSNTNPMLDLAGLANNGGPTQTIALQNGSPAINAGNESICAAASVNNLDQRGYLRPGAGAMHCSIGAYEYKGISTSPTTCVGDCDGSGEVTVDEIITLVNIALGTAQTSACPDGSWNGGSVDITLIVQAVGNALSSCPAA